MTRSIKAGRRVKLAHVGLFADGVAVKQVGAETFRIARELVDEMVLVDTDATCAALKDVFEDTRSILEPAGALAIAGVKAWVERHRTKDRTFVAIACGANMNFDRLRFVAERAELGERREAILAVTIAERPGASGLSAAFLANVRSPSSTTDTPTRGRASLRRHEVAGRLTERLWLIYATGSRRTTSPTTRCCLFAPSAACPGCGERDPLLVGTSRASGALMRFLNSMSRGWNISLFHYRNHGADYGRVLVGMQVPPADSASSAPSSTWARLRR